MVASWQENYDKPRQYVKKQRHHFVNKGSYHQRYGFSNSHIRLWELDHKECGVLKNWCFWIVVLEKTLERPLDCKENQPVNLKGNQPWILNRRTNAGAEAPILMQIASSLEKTLMLGKTESRGEEGDRGCHGWVVSPMQWTRTWANSGNWWETGKPGTLQSMGLQRDGHELVTEQPQHSHMLG